MKCLLEKIRILLLSVHLGLIIVAIFGKFQICVLVNTTILLYNGICRKTSQMFLFLIVCVCVCDKYVVFLSFTQHFYTMFNIELWFISSYCC